MIKKIIYTLAGILVFVGIILLTINFMNFTDPTKVAIIRNLLPKQFKDLIKERVCLYRYHESLEYKNERIFPQTQFVKLNYSEIKIKGLESQSREFYFKDTKRYGQKVVSFYIETFDDNNILVAKSGATFLDNSLNFLKDKKVKTLEINNNLPKNISVDDTMIYKNKIFFSFRKRNESCENRQIYSADLNFNFLNFEEFYSHGTTKKCEIDHSVEGGRMALYDDNGDLSFIISTNYPNDENHKLLKNYSKPRETVMLLINYETKKFRIFTSGHRNPQGLLVNEKNMIISTEHGPRGGDEINKIIEGNHYGWPFASYGVGGDNLNLNHSDHGFTEPIYAFVPSIGISQIIKVPEEFTPEWPNSYLVTSLKRGVIYRVVFDKNYSRIITMERMRIGKRIRDIAYNKKYKSFLLALENESGSIGYISAN